MSHIDAIQRGFSLVAWLATEVDGLSLDGSLRNRLSAACLSVTQDHHAAIIVLLEQKLYASAFTLARPQYESYVRGLWLANCATDVEVERFATGDEPPGITVLLASLQKVEAFENGMLSKIKQDSWRDMCEYTHTGALQAKRWLTEAGIEQNYPAEEIEMLANFAGSIALLSGIGTAMIAQNEQLANRLLERSREHAEA